MAIPVTLTHDEIVSAMEKLGPDSGGWPRRRRSTRYDVIHPDPSKRWRMPPKLVISTAAEIAGHPRFRFSGGPETNDFLVKRDFEILDRKMP